MKQLMFVVVTLGLACGTVACKKDDKKADDSAKAGGDPKAVDPGNPAGGTPTPGTGELAASKDPAPVEAKPGSGDGLAMVWKAPAVGLKVEQADSLITKMKLTIAPGQTVDLTITKSEKTHLEVVEVGGEGAPTKIKVHYAEYAERQEMGGQTETKPSAIAGKAYVVWVDGEVVKATHDDGSAVSPEELEELEDNHKKDLGKIPGIAKVLTGKTWKPNETVTMTPEELKTLALGSEDKVVPAAGTITLHGVDGGIATFAIAVVGVLEDAEGKLEMPMAVTAKIDVANVRPLEITMTGTLDGKVQGMATTGSVEGKKAFSYQ